MRREFCCSNCGLIWFGGENVTREKVCPECKTSSPTDIYACDTFGYAYASEGIQTSLEAQGKQIHYAEDHPFLRNKKLFKHRKDNNYL